MSIIQNTLALILVLSVLVVVHEFGHYAVAKAFGFPVEVFSIGFGKRFSAGNGRDGLPGSAILHGRLRQGHRARARRIHLAEGTRPRLSGRQRWQRR